MAAIGPLSAVRAVDVDQPVAVDGHLVTFWDAVLDDGDQYASAAEIAAPLAKLHALTAPLAKQAVRRFIQGRPQVLAS